jgi:hypothetical protein
MNFYPTPLFRSVGLALLLTISGSAVAQQRAQQSGFARLDKSVLPISSPATRVQGAPGNMTIIERTCASAPSADLRRRIVNTAVQEWAFFGFGVDEQRTATPATGAGTNGNNNRRRFPLLDPEEGLRIADSIGGYWAAAPNSDWILQRQNEAWNGENGLASRHRDPWSAAFISWVMCESGLGQPEQFQRAIAHHSYIDQAIKARDNKDSAAMYTAFDIGEAEIEPGDLLCSGMRPVYRSIEGRRQQLGVGARTHCDIVVQVDTTKRQILTIGGNVGSSVRMKVFSAAVTAAKHFAPLPTARLLFAHLKLKATAVSQDALLQSPTLHALQCTMPVVPSSFATASLSLPATSC